MFENVHIENFGEINVTESQYTNIKFHLSSFASHMMAPTKLRNQNAGGHHGEKKVKLCLSWLYDTQVTKVKYMILFLPAYQ